MFRRRRPPIALLVLLAALALRVSDPRFVADLRLAVFDAFQRVAPRAYTPVRVSVVDLDNESLDRVGQWPWPRSLVADLVDRLTALGAQVIAFDVVFAEPDRTSPSAVFALWPELAELAPAGGLPDHDAMLVESLEKSPVVTGFSLLPDPGGDAVVAKVGFAHRGPDPRPFLRDLPGAVASLPPLQTAAKGNGCFSVQADGDGIYRRIPMLYRKGDQLFPSLAAEAIRVARGAETYKIKTNTAGIDEIAIGELRVPTDARGRFWVHYTDPRPERLIPAWKVLADDVERSAVEGHVIFIGTSAAGLADLRPTPVDAVMPGVLVHAQVAEQILLQHFLTRPSWARGAEVVYMLALGCGLILLQRRLGALGGALLATTAITGAIGFSWWAYLEPRWLVDPIFPSLAVLSVYLTISLLNYRQSEAQRREIRSAFGHYVSPDFVAQLAANPDLLVLGGERRTLTILFADIRGFTTISEQFEDPQELITLINRFLTPMTELVMERKGTIDKYIGDCIMAFWNAPIDDPEHARNGCASALAMFEGLEQLNDTLAAEARAAGRDPQPLRIGIGLNTGECCVGNMGSDQRFDYSILGDCVNLAARLEGQSKTYRVDTVIGDDTRRAAAEFATLELDLIQVKGKLEAARIHALLGDRALAESEEFLELARLHGKMLEAYRAQRWQDALAALEGCRGCGLGPDGLYDLYAARIAAYQETPPPADWDGVFVAESK